MKSAREKILSNIRRSLKRNEVSLAEMQQCHARLVHHPRSHYAKQNHDHFSLESFIKAAEHANAYVNMIAELNTLPEIILEIIKKHQLTSSITISNDALFQTIDWSAYAIQVKPKIDADNMLSLTRCFCAIAETGTLVMLSNLHPTTYNFLANVHVVLLNKDEIVKLYEDAWDKIRVNKINCRTVHFITGPSRTGDIEQTLQLGMHGPKHLYILIYDQDKDVTHVN